MRAVLVVVSGLLLAGGSAAAQVPDRPARVAIGDPVADQAAFELPKVDVSEFDLRPPAVRVFRSRADSLDFERARATAGRASGYRIVIELFERRLFVMDGADTLLVAPVAVGMSDSVIAEGERKWRFDTPRGVRRVIRKEADPVWVPPDWHYIEVAAQLDLELQYLSANRPVDLGEGRRLTVRERHVGVQEGTDFTPLAPNEHIIFDGVLYVPPFGTENRRIPGELGRFRLDLGSGYLLHGTPHEDSIGFAATHGCVRLFDEDIEWLFENVPVGTRVFIY